MAMEINKEEQHLYWLDTMLVPLTKEQVERGKKLGFHIERALEDDILV